MKKVKKIFKIGEKTFNSVFQINSSLILLNFELMFPYPPPTTESLLFKYPWGLKGGDKGPIGGNGA